MPLNHQKVEDQATMKKLDIGGRCATSLISYLYELQLEEIWHQENAKRQKAYDIEAQYAGRVRLLNYLIWEAESNLATNEEL